MNLHSVQPPVRALLALTVGLFACAGPNRRDVHPERPAYGPSVYVAPRARAVKKVAVLPFRAPTALIGESVADLWVTEILRSGRHEVVERSRLSAVLGEAELALSGLSSSRAAEIGTMAGADAIVMGTVDEYSTSAQSGRVVPVVSLSARMVDCASGDVLWSAEHSVKGAPNQTPSLLARRAVNEMMSAIYRRY